ncbi:MAG: helix-turn-helix domain-containing protein [Bdellovibrionales bacterium]
MSELLSIKQACLRLGLGRTKVYDLMAAQSLRAIKCGRRTLLKADDVAEFIRDLPAYKSVIGGDK